MTESNPPYVLQARTDHTAELFRMALRSVTGSSEGIVDPTDLAVTQRGAGANMSVDVAAGNVVIRGDENTGQGTYHCYNNGTVNLVIAAAHPSWARWDLIVAKVADTAYSGATDAWSLAVVQGTPAGSPSDPATPNNAVVLARVVVGASVTQILNANIADLRPRVTGAGGITPANSARRPGASYGAGGLHVGSMTYDTDTNQLMVYNGSAWVCVTPVSAYNLAQVSRTTASYIDAGPSVTLQTGTKVVVTIGCYSNVNTPWYGCSASYAVSGASTISASDVWAVRNYSEAGYDELAASFTSYQTTLTPGSNTFSMQYKGNGQSASYFTNRFITVVGIP